jgi:hypothetical protein
MPHSLRRRHTLPVPELWPDRTQHRCTCPSWLCWSVHVSTADLRPIVMRVMRGYRTEAAPSLHCRSCCDRRWVLKRQTGNVDLRWRKADTHRRPLTVSSSWHLMCGTLLTVVRQARGTARFGRWRRTGLWRLVSQVGMPVESTGTQGFISCHTPSLLACPVYCKRSYGNEHFTR